MFRCVRTFVALRVAYRYWQNKFGPDHNAVPGICTVAATRQDQDDIACCSSSGHGGSGGSRASDGVGACKDFQEGIVKNSLWVFGYVHQAQRNESIRPHEKAAFFVNFTKASPVTIGIFCIGTGSDDPPHSFGTFERSEGNITQIGR
jgi:hypothetical protein